jgi:hypothetical protein
MTEQEQKKRDSDATSKETLHDLNENEKLAEEKGRDRVKSPDGSFDQDKELKDAEPM